MTLKFSYQAKANEFKANIDLGFLSIEEAATGAMREVGDIVKLDARANIAAAGFSRRWQNALRVDVFPQRTVSASPAAFVHHKIPYAGVFETGATVRGKPMLWLPLSNVSRPRKLPPKVSLPRFISAKVGGLHTIKAPGKPPLLGAKLRLTDSQARKKISPGLLSKGSKAKSATLRSVPLFVGVPQVKLPDKLNIAGVAKRARDKLARLYTENFRAP